MFCRLFGPSTSRNAVEQFRFRRMCQTLSEASNDRKPLEVSTTGYTYRTSDGQLKAKYGVYWGPRDRRNTFRQLPDGTSFLEAVYHSILDAVITAREDDIQSPLIVYTDLMKEDFLQDLSKWARRDFYLRNENRLMNNAEILKDLHMAIQGLDIKLVHRKAAGTGEPNYVVTAIIDDGKYQKEEKEEVDEKPLEEMTNRERLARYCTAEDFSTKTFGIGVFYGDEFDKNGKIVTRKAASKNWPVVYVGMKCIEQDGFFLASYATSWPNGEAGGGCAKRFVPFPITTYRALLGAIEEALKEAYDENIQNVIVLTNNAFFVESWKNRWIGVNGEHLPSKEFYDRMVDLCERIKNVHFRYELFSYKVKGEIEEKCNEGLKMPMIGKDKSEYELTIDDLTIDRTHIDEKIPVVRIFKTGTELNAGYVWSNESGVNVCGMPATIIRIMREAIERNYNSIVVRTDSPKLIKSFEAHLEVWKRNGWRNSMHKKIAKASEWEEAWRLKKNVKIYWELMDTVTVEDEAENKKIPEYERKRLEAS